jgi:hypothetical protein
MHRFYDYSNWSYYFEYFVCYLDLCFVYSNWSYCIFLVLAISFTYLNSDVLSCVYHNIGFDSLLIFTTLTSYAYEHICITKVFP